MTDKTGIDEDAMHSGCLFYWLLLAICLVAFVLTITVIAVFNHAEI